MRTPAIAAVVLLTIGHAAPALAQVPTFSSKRDAVRVDARVTSNGQIVRDLKAEDFEVLDNGVRQEIDIVGFENLPLNIVMVLDASNSVAGERMDHLRAAGVSLLAALKPDDRAGLVTFSNVVILRQDLTSDVARLRAALDDVDPLGPEDPRDTSVIDGMYTALKFGGAEIGRTLMIVFSDGVDTGSWLMPEDVIDSARRSDVVVYAASVRGPYKASLLEDLAEATGGNVFEVESTRDLGAAFLRILEEFRQRYLLSYSPTGVAPDGWHRLEVKVRNRRATVRARAGYQAGP